MFVFSPCNWISQISTFPLYIHTLSCSPTITLQAYIKGDAGNLYSTSELSGRFNAKHVTAETAVIVPVRAIRTYKTILKNSAGGRGSGEGEMLCCGEVWKPVVRWISQITLSFNTWDSFFTVFILGSATDFTMWLLAIKKMKQSFHFLSQLQVFPTLSFTLSLVNSQAPLFLYKNFLFTPLLLRTWVTECLTARTRPIKTLFFRDVQFTSRSLSPSRKPIPFNFDYKKLSPWTTPFSNHCLLIGIISCFPTDFPPGYSIHAPPLPF